MLDPSAEMDLEVEEDQEATRMGATMLKAKAVARVDAQAHRAHVEVSTGTLAMSGAVTVLEMMVEMVVEAVAWDTQMCPITRPVNMQTTPQCRLQMPAEQQIEQKKKQTKPPFFHSRQLVHYRLVHRGLSNLISKCGVSQS